MIVRSFRESDFDEVISIHKICFEIFAFDYEKHMDLYRKFFNSNRTVVADTGRELVGFGCYSLFDDEFLIEPDGMQDIVDYINLEGQIKHDMLEKMRKKQEESEKGKLVVERLDNWFSESNYEVQRGDTDFTSLAVLPQHRRAGIGQLLTLERIKMARAQGSSAGFVSCWEGGHSSSLYESLDYIAIARVGPMYNDGQSALVMGKKF